MTIQEEYLAYLKTKEREKTLSDGAVNKVKEILLEKEKEAYKQILTDYPDLSLQELSKELGISYTTLKGKIRFFELNYKYKTE